MILRVGLGILILNGFICCINWHTILLAQPRTELKEKTVREFEQYVSSVEKKYESASRNGTPALWIDKLDADTRLAIRNGEIVIERVEPIPDVADGIIHDWVGAVFIPGGQAQEVVDLLTDYDRHQAIYPEALESKALEKGDEYARGFIRLRKTEVLTVVLNTEHKAEILTKGEGRSMVVSRSTKIAEVRNPGEPTERELPVGEDSGFLWRLNAYWTIDQGVDGVTAECRTISLSRSIPWGLAWAVGPFLESMPYEALDATLQVTRRVLSKGTGKPE